MKRIIYIQFAVHRGLLAIIVLVMQSHAHSSIDSISLYRLFLPVAEENMCLARGALVFPLFAIFLIDTFFIGLKALDWQPKQHFLLHRVGQLPA